MNKEDLFNNLKKLDPNIIINIDQIKITKDFINIDLGKKYGNPIKYNIKNRTKQEILYSLLLNITSITNNYQSNKSTGEQGENLVVKLIPCPNCSKELMKLPTNYPLYDVQCIGCNFRAQVKTVSRKPCSSIFGAGWDIYEKVMKAGFLPPVLLINFCWHDKNGAHREIRFYPFVAKNNIKKYQLSPNARRPNYRMFKYIKLDKIPHITLYKS